MNAHFCHPRALCAKHTTHLEDLTQWTPKELIAQQCAHCGFTITAEEALRALNAQRLLRTLHGSVGR